MDAAIAANAMLAVVYCNACGLGGDAFALVWDPPGAPPRLQRQRPLTRRLTIEAVRAAGHDAMPARGPLPINVPGAVDAWAQLLDRFGRRSLADACARRTVADEGYALTPSPPAPSPPPCPTFDGTAAHRLRTCRRTGRYLPPAATWRRPCGRWREGGRDAYYGGPIGDEIARADPCRGRRDDRRRHCGAPRRLGRAHLHRLPRGRGRHVPPNSQGITALMALNVLSTLDWPMDARFRATSRPARGGQGCLERARPMRGGPRPRSRRPGRAPIGGACALAGVAPVARSGAAVHADQPARRGDDLPVRRRCRRDDGQPDRVELHGLRLRASWAARPGSCSRTAAPTSRSTRGTRTRSRRARGRSTRSCQACCCGTAVAEVALGAMGGDGQPQTMVQLVTGLVDDGSTRRRSWTVRAGWPRPKGPAGRSAR